MGSWPWATVLGLLVGDLGAVNEGLQWAVGVGDSLFLSSGGLIKTGCVGARFLLKVSQRKPPPINAW